MSLTRQEWEEMWKTCKTIEGLLRFAMPLVTRQRLQNQVNKIKKQIQSVIGQME